MGAPQSEWRKSSASVKSDCVEVRIDQESVAVRNTRSRDAATLHFSHAEWKAFVSGVKSGEFEIPD